MDLSLFKNKKIFVTGHTGFKGAWLCGILKNAGANVTGFALEPPQNGAFNLCALEKYVNSHIGDVRDFDALFSVFRESSPEIVVHMAAQPLVLDSYTRPLYTFDTNVMGTANVLECVRLNSGVKSVLVVTTDKVYRNREWHYGYRENDELGGDDPYAASKACAELVTNSYFASFFRKAGIPVSTARAGNVIGGGDASENRIIPDCIKATCKDEAIFVRNPHSVRPYQHVLEPLFAYLLIIQKQHHDISLAGNYNIGPTSDGCVTTGELAGIFCNAWGNPARWVTDAGAKNAQHEAGLLHLDCAKARTIFNWNPTWNVEKAVEMTVQWEKSRIAGANMNNEMSKQINMYLTKE